MTQRLGADTDVFQRADAVHAEIGREVKTR